MNRKSKLKIVISRMALLIFAVFLALVAAEVALRITVYVHQAQRREDWKRVREQARVPNGAEVGLGQSIRINDNPKIVYELIPDLKVIFRGKPLHTDKRGNRLIPHNLPADKPVVRFVGLGDSFMFGWDVHDDECYMALLSKRLNRQYPSHAWEIVNTAVPGYNTVMQVEAFRTKDIVLEPNIVLVHFVVNDLDPPNFVVMPTSILSTGHLYLRELLRKGFRYKWRGTDHLIRLTDSPEKGSAAYGYMVGKGPYRKSMEQLVKLSRKHSFRLLVLAERRAPRYVNDVCQEFDIPLIQTDDAVAEYLGSPSTEAFANSDLIQSRNDSHPSAAGHRLYADVVYDYLEKSGTITELATASPDEE